MGVREAGARVLKAGKTRLDKAVSSAREGDGYLRGGRLKQEGERDRTADARATKWAVRLARQRFKRDGATRDGEGERVAEGRAGNPRTSRTTQRGLRGGLRGAFVWALSVALCATARKRRRGARAAVGQRVRAACARARAAAAAAALARAVRGRAQRARRGATNCCTCSTVYSDARMQLARPCVREHSCACTVVCTAHCECVLIQSVLQCPRAFSVLLQLRSPSPSPHGSDTTAARMLGRSRRSAGRDRVSPQHADGRQLCVTEHVASRAQHIRYLLCINATRCPSRAS
ncbi:hypothetical protein FGB62_11g362 [Gracilaria domingensis]|nr:hypothetical protein FGB62_11g362 [Gracilaria domingensis]